MYRPPSEYTVPPPNIGIPPPAPAAAGPSPFYTQSNAAGSLPPSYQPPPSSAHEVFPAPPVLYRSSAVDMYYAPSNMYFAPTPYLDPRFPPPPPYNTLNNSTRSSYAHRESSYDHRESSYSQRDSRHTQSRESSYSQRESTNPHRESRSRHSPSRDRRHDMERECRKMYNEAHRSRSPHRNDSRSPSRHSMGSRSSHYSRSSRHHSSRSPSRYHSSRSPSRHYSSRSPSRHHSSRRSPSISESRMIELRRYYEKRKRKHEMERQMMERRDPGAKELDENSSCSQSRTHDEREHRRSPSKRTCRSPSRETHVSLRGHKSNSPRHRHERDSKRPLTDREKILEEYRKNYCQTSEDLIAKMKQYIEEEEVVS